MVPLTKFPALKSARPKSNSSAHQHDPYLLLLAELSQFHSLNLKPKKLDSSGNWQVLALLVFLPIITIAAVKLGITSVVLLVQCMWIKTSCIAMQVAQQELLRTKTEFATLAQI